MAVDEVKLVLSDGREVVRGPWLQLAGFFNFNRDEFEVGIFVINPEEKDKRLRMQLKNLKILKLTILTRDLGICLPNFKILGQDLWTKKLIQVVIDMLSSEKGYPAKTAGFTYIAANLAAAFQPPKELKLPCGVRLIGDFQYDYNIFESKLEIVGNVRNADGTTVQVTVFTVRNLTSDIWPQPPKPIWEKNREIWGKTLECLVISYLEILARFADHAMSKRITAVAAELKEYTEWAATLRRISAILRGLSPQQQEDPRIKRALELIEETQQA